MKYWFRVYFSKHFCRLKMFFEMHDCNSVLNDVTEMMLYTDVVKTEISIEGQKNIIDQARCCEKMRQ